MSKQYYDYDKWTQNIGCGATAHTFLKLVPERLEALSSPKHAYSTCTVFFLHVSSCFFVCFLFCSLQNLHVGLSSHYLFLLLCRICMCPDTIFFFSAELACRPLLVLSSLQNLHIYRACPGAIFFFSAEHACRPIPVLFFSAEHTHIGLSWYCLFLLCRTCM